MKIKETNLGGGLSRLDAIPMVNAERNMPVEVIDEMMRDIIMRKNNEGECVCHSNHNCCCHNDNDYCHRMTHCMRDERCNEPMYQPMDEPDGIDVHVDRPLRENFYDFSDWCEAMAKYRTLEHVAKDCDWECREPMKGTEEYEDYNCDDYNDEYFDDNDDFIYDDDEDEDDEKIVICIHF